MSTTLLLMIPIVILAVVWSLCFVGSCFPTGGLAPPYSNVILQETSLVAYWPLSDLPGPSPAPPFPPVPAGSTGVGIANDLSGNGHTGSYLVPPAYPSATTFPLSMSFASPALTLHQASIVPGDALAQGSKNLPACVNFEGGYVSIPWSSNSPQLDVFTVEAWVQLNWTQAGNRWVVFGAVTATAGFVLFVNENNNWAIAIGDGSTTNLLDTGIQAPIMISPKPTGGTYVAVTLAADGLLRLWINPSSDTSAPPTATWTSPTTVNYAPVDPTQQPLTFFIGAGYNEEPVRTQGGVIGAPMYPFQGFIQSVALYSSALDATDLGVHFEEGATSDNT
jgi:hypothetical protein